MEKKEFETSKIKIREINEDDVVRTSPGTLVPDDEDYDELVSGIGFMIG